MTSTEFQPFGQSKKMGGDAEASRPRIHDMFNVATETAKVKAKPSLLDAYPAERRRVEAWFRACVKKAEESGPHTQALELTPPVAEFLLTRNPSNRTVGQSVVEKYARDIQNGRFAFNGEPIIISRDGLLNDGQHRCLAVAKAARAIRTIVVFGPERESRFTLDQGRVRTIGDYLGMNGVEHSNGVAATANMVWQFRELGRLSVQGKDKPTKSEALLLVESYPDIGACYAAIPSSVGPLGSKAFVAFCRYIFIKKSTEGDADEFIGRLIDGANLSPGDPILYARNRLINGHSRATNGTARMRVDAKAELVFRAWNAHRRGDKVKTLPVLGGKLPDLEP